MKTIIRLNFNRTVNLMAGSFTLDTNKVKTAFLSTLAILLSVSLGGLFAQGQGTAPYPVGNPLGLPEYSNAEGDFEPISSNVKVYGAIYSAESCSYDPVRDVIVVPNRGVPQNVRTNDSWISLINHDGSVHTSRWIGIQNANDRANLNPPLIINDPLGSDIVNGMLYLADRDGGTHSDDPTVAVIRVFNMETGAPVKEIRIEDSPWVNDLAVADDGTIYTTQTGEFGENPDKLSWKVWKINPDGEAVVFVEGLPLLQPNGIAFDPEGNIVVANFGNADVLTFSTDGELLKTEKAAQAAGDGLVIMPDGTKYVCSVRHGGLSRIRPGEPAQLIAKNIPSAASMCYDAGANQLVIPMTSNGTLAFIKLE